MRARREALGGYVPQRKVRAKPLVADHDELFKEFFEGSDGREVSTTMAFVGMLRKMLKDQEIGKLIVPIVPDEARTFGMESLFRTVGIYSSVGQRYEPVDVNTLLYYKEAKDGQILEEGITEAGSMASFIAAGSAYATHRIAVIIQDGIRRMYKDGESIFYYLTVMNEPYAMPAMPGDVKDGILRGMYRFRKAANGKSKLRAQLFGSGAILNEALRAQEILETKYGVAADVWSVTSYKELYNDGIETERWNRLHPGEKDAA